jgi:UDP-N-acetylmuramate dehydrogenase
MALSSLLADALPALRGRIQAGVALAPVTWFRVGGAAELLVRPADTEDLAGLLAALPLQVPVTVIGAASNLIVRDGGIHGVVLRLVRGFADIAIEADGVVAGAGALDVTVALAAAEAGLDGLQFLSGIPGTIGGAVAMNAGAYGGDMAGCLDWADVVTRSGEVVRLDAGRLGLAYRHSALPPGGIVTRARLRAGRADPARIQADIAAIQAQRAATQPVRARTGGSTFRNPPDQKAWELIDAAGCRGLRRGGAQVSELHCNFLLNTGDATAADIEGLGEDVRTRVRETSGVELRWEIRRVGIPA